MVSQLSKRLAAVAVGAALGGLASGAFGGGFGIGTQSGSGTGNAFAGGAAAADDASVTWYNPAAMMALPSGSQVAGALHAVKTSFKFQNQGSTGVYAAPGTGDVSVSSVASFSLEPELFERPHAAVRMQQAITSARVTAAPRIRP